MTTRILCLLLSWLVAFQAYGVDINGELKRALLEKQASDPTGYEARVYWDTATKAAKVYNGSAWQALGSGSGGGAWNAVENGDWESASVPAEWTTYDDTALAAPVNCTGGSPATVTTAARTTTAAEVDTDTAAGDFVKSAADGQGEGWAYTFQLPSHLRNGTVNLNWDQIITDADVAAGDIRVYVYDVDNSVLITPSFITMGGGTTPDLAAGNGAVRMSFLATTADDYRLCIHVATTDASAYDIWLDNIFIGDSGITVGSGGPGAWNTYVPVGSCVSNCTYSGKWRRNDNNIEGFVEVAFAGAITAGNLSVDVVPSGLSTDSSILSIVSNLPAVGKGTAFDGSTNAYPVTVTLLDTNSVYFTTGSTAGSATGQMQNDSPVTWGASDGLAFEFSIPIAEWAGGQALGENHCEYAFNTDVTDADDTTDFGYGPAGTPLPGSAFATGNRSKTVQFRSAISSTDRITFEVQETTGTGGFKEVNFVGPMNFSAYALQNATSYGIGISSCPTATTCLVKIGKYALASGTTYASNGSDWSATTDNASWRLSKCKGGSVVPFGLATSTQPGLINYFQNANVSTTLTFDGSGSGDTQNVEYTRLGNAVTACLGLFRATTGTSSTQMASAASAIPSWALPAQNLAFYSAFTRNNAVLDATGPGKLTMNSDGSIALQRFGAPANFTNSASGGLQARTCVNYSTTNP